ncbi:unnamed protein product [Orchesella dallaii]|uniref:NACHT domain-containing protein n=1 Tax=Orchesella dallaii TaxID=48710 RepID=A0ABP1RAC0_9HEXA
MDTITLEATPEQYYYTAVDKMLISSCQILQQLFQARWAKHHGQDWEQGNYNQVKKTHETLAKKKQKLTGAEKEKLEGCIEDWDMTLLFKLLMNLWTEMEREYKVENDAVSQLKKLRNLWAHSSSHMISENDYNLMKEIFTKSLKTLKVKENEIKEMIERAEATSIPQEGNTSNYKDITTLTKWDDLSNGLKSAMGNNKETYYQGKRIKLKSLNEQLELSNLDGVLLVKLANGEIPSVVNNQVPDKLQYNVNRRVKSRNKLKRELFQIISNDVIVVQGMEKHELTSLVGGQETDVSGSQINRLTVRFILLEYEPDYEKICKLTSAPVHWIRFKNNNYEWVKSSGSVKNLQKYVQETQDSFEEEELATTTSHYKVTVISDTPGMGKTVLLANIAHQIMRQQPNMIVRFIVIKELVQSLNKKKKALDVDSIVSLIAEQSSEFEYGQKLIVNSLKSTPSILMFDGFDEVLSQDINTALMVLKTVVEELTLVRVYVTTRPHMREQLENGLHVLGFTISPFDKADQINFLIKFWNFEGVPINKSVHEFAKICLNALSSRITDLERDIAGIPLQCRLLAEVYTESVMRCSQVGYEAYHNSIVVTTSIFEMYEMHMNMRFQKIAASESVFKRLWTILLNTKSQYDAIKTSHMYYALALLFPDYVHEFEKDINPTIPLQNLCALGIVEKTESKTPRFIHRTFAEYLIAWLVVEMKPNEKFLSFLLNILLGTNSSKEYMSTPFGNSDPVSSHNFNFPVITYFINGFTKKLEKIHATKDPSSNHGLKNKISMMLTDSVQHKQVTRIFSAAAVNDFAHVPLAVTVTLSCQDFQSHAHIENPYLSDLLLITAKFCGVELMKTYCSQLDLTTMQFFYSKSGSFYITPLHVAIQRGQYALVEYLVRSYKHQLYNLRYLLHFCVFESKNESSLTIKDKIQIIKLLMGKNKSLANEQLPDGSTPFMQKNASLELVECLIVEGADVNICDKREETVLHKIVETHISPEAYHRVLLALREKGFEHINKPNFKGVIPLHCAVENVNVLKETLQVFKTCVEADVDFNDVDNAGDSVLFYAIRGRRSAPVIQMLIDFGADLNHANKRGKNVLHICTKYGNYDALKYLLDNYPLDVNKDDAIALSAGIRAKKPLHYAIMKRSKSYEMMQKLLIEKGADLSHRSDFSSKSQFIQAFNPGKGLNVNILQFMEKHGLEITPKVATNALNEVLLNKNIMSWEIDKEFLEMLEYLVEKGGYVRAGYEYEELSPWDFEFVKKNLNAIIQATDISPLFLTQALKYKLLTEQELTEIKRLATNVRKSEYFYKTAEGKEGSFERICLISLSSNQMNMFLLLRQCLQALRNMFVTPPPRVIQFINSPQNGVMVVLTHSLYLGIRRIREAIGSEAILIEEHDIPRVESVKSDKVIVLKCRVVTDQLVSKLLLLHCKFICVSTKMNGDLENCIVVSDTYTWEDIGSEIVNAFRFIVDGKLCRVNELFASPEILQMLPENDAFRRDYSNEVASFKVGHEVGMGNDSGGSSLSNSIFHYILHDKLTFFGITEQELKQIGKFGQSIGHYGGDLENLDYIILEHPDQFQEICNQTTLTVHLIEHNEGRFKLVRTFGSDNEIKPFLETKKLCDTFPLCKNCKGDYDQLLVHFTFNNYNSFQNERVVEWRARICELLPRMLELLELQDTRELLQLTKLLKSSNLEFNQTDELSTKVEQITVLMEVFVENLKCSESEWKKLQCVAVNTVLPNFVKNVETSGLEKYEKTGVLRYKDNSLVFVHETVSAYIIAELIMVNERTAINELLDLDSLRFEIYENFFQSHVLLMRTRRYNIDLLEAFSYPTSPINIFKNNRILYFIESHINNECFDNPLTNHLKSNSSSDLASKWIFACVYANRFHLLQMLFTLGIQSLFTKWEQLLMLAVKCGDIPIIDLVVNRYLIQQSSKHIQDLEFKLESVDRYFEETITILHAAILRGNFSVITHLLNHYGFKDTLNHPVMCDILHFCVIDTNKNMSQEEISNRKSIIQLFLQFNPLVINQRDKINRTALLVPNIHVELIIHLIKLGVDVYATDGGDDCNNILHVFPTYLSPEEFDAVVKTLNDMGHSKIFDLIKGRWMVAPLYCAVDNIEVLDSTLELFSSVKVDFNCVFSDGDTVLISAIIKRRSMRLLDALVRGGSDINKTGQHHRTVLHVAARYGNLSALRHFIMKGCDVNATDAYGDTPLHLGIKNLYNDSVQEVVQMLVRNGAHVNKVGKKQQTPLSLAIDRNKRQKEDLGSTIEFLKHAGAR